MKISVEARILENVDVFSRLCFAKPTRRLGNKTQMFGGGRYDVHLHNRLSHSVEVLSIATKLFNACCKHLPNELDIYLLSSIAIGHDFGHTPFGHSGEEELNRLIKKMLGNKINRSASFKHNINSVRVLLDDEKIYSQSGNNCIKYKEFLSNEYDWRLFDGILNHTSTYNQRFSKSVNKDEYNLEYTLSLHPVFNNIDFQKMIIKVANDHYYSNKFDGVTFNNKFSMDNFVDAYLYLNTPLSIEGMIIRISDEIAQRISDISDIFEYAIKKHDNSAFYLLDEFVEKLKSNLIPFQNIKEETKKHKGEKKTRKTSYRHRICSSTIDLINFCRRELSSFKTESDSNKKQHSQRVIKKIYDYFVANECEYIDFLMKKIDNVKTKSFSVRFKNCKTNYKIYYPVPKKDNTYGPFLDLEEEFVSVIDSELSSLSKNAYDKIEDIMLNNRNGKKYIKKLFMSYSKNADVQEFSSRHKVANNIKEYLKEKNINIYNQINIETNDNLKSIMTQIEKQIDKKDLELNKVYCLFFYGIASEISLYTNNICKEKANKLRKKVDI